MGLNPSFFKLVKHVMRDSSNMSYINNLLSLSSLLKNKEVCIVHGGGKFEGSGSVFWKSLWQLFVVTLEHDVCLHLILKLDNFLVSESYQSYESLYSFDPPEEFPNYRRTMFWSISHQFNVAKSFVVPHNVQGKF
jgi:hypothetical protein